MHHNEGKKKACKEKMNVQSFQQRLYYLLVTAMQQAENIFSKAVRKISAMTVHEYKIFYVTHLKICLLFPEDFHIPSVFR